MEPLINEIIEIRAGFGDFKAILRIKWVETSDSLSFEQKMQYIADILFK